MNDGTAEAGLAGRVSAAMYAKDRAAQMLGIQLRTVRHGYAELTMTVREDMLNVHGLCHGGLVFALADTAFGYACHTRNQANVALQGAISFTAPARLGDELIAVAERARAGRMEVEPCEPVPVVFEPCEPPLPAVEACEAEAPAAAFAGALVGGTALSVLAALARLAAPSSPTRISVAKTILLPSRSD